MLPPTASPAEGIWPPRLLEGVDLVTASEQSDPSLAEVAKGHLPENRGHHRRRARAVLIRLELGPDLSPAQPPDISRDMHPAVFRLKLLSEFPQATVSRSSHVPGKRDVVDPDPLPLLLGDNIPDAALRHIGRPKYRIPVLQEVLQGGGRGCDANTATVCRRSCVHTAPRHLISTHSEAMGGFYRRQYSCRVKRLAVDAVGIVIAETQEAWRRGGIAGAFLMDVAAAFPSVARGCLLRKMRGMGLGGFLVQWTDSFMRDRRVIMSVDGQDGEPMDVMMGLPQGSPVCPVLLAIYIAEVDEAIESQVEGCRGISFVDDVTWLAKGTNLDDIIKLEQCARASLEWAANNAVRFETSKTGCPFLQEMGPPPVRASGPSRGPVRKGQRRRFLLSWWTLEWSAGHPLWLR